MQAENTSPGQISRIMTALTSSFPVSQDHIRQLALRVAAFRQNKGFTQAALAQRLGITEGRYGHYERGFRRFPVDLLPKLAQVLACSEAELLGAPPSKAKRGPPSDWEKRIRVIQDLPRDKQREIQNVVDALIAKAG
jgi:transcriptional regulator with XRE-family HTH domain